MSKEKTNIQRELREQEAPLLSKWQNKANSWSMPEGYLDRLSERALDTAQQPISLVKRKPSSSYARWAVAASIALLFLATSWWFTNSTTGEDASLATWDDISTEDIHLFLDDHLEDLDIALLAEDFEGDEWISTDEDFDAIEEYLEESDFLIEEDWEEDLF